MEKKNQEEVGKKIKEHEKIIRGGKISRREVGSRILEKTGHEKVVGWRPLASK